MLATAIGVGYVPIVPGARTTAATTAATATKASSKAAAARGTRGSLRRPSKEPAPPITSGREITEEMLERAELTWDRHFQEQSSFPWREFYERLAEDGGPRVQPRSAAATKIERHLSPLLRILRLAKRAQAISTPTPE